MKRKNTTIDFCMYVCIHRAALTAARRVKASGKMEESAADGLWKQILKVSALNGNGTMAEHLRSVNVNRGTVRERKKHKKLNGNMKD